MSEVRVNKLSPRSGTTVTLGDSGDTISIPSGVTLSTTSFSSTGIDDNATSTAITIDSSERVGIGTSSPQKPLHINSSVDEILRLETPDNQTGNIYQAIHDASGELARIGMFDSSRIFRINNLQSDGEIGFFTDNSEAMRIISDGKVGIGTSSPSPDYGSDNILEIAGSTNPGLVINDTGQASKYGIHAVSADFLMMYGTTAFLRYKPGDSQLTSHDNVRIITGTASGVTPNTLADKLFIDGNGNSGMTIASGTSSVGQIFFADSGDNDIGKLSYTHNENAMMFTVNAAERMRIDSSGNVLVGKTSSSTANVGIQLAQPGNASFTSDNSIPLIANRKTTDGDIIVVRKDNSTVGNIGVAQSDRFYFAGNTYGLSIDNSGAYCMPSNSSGNENDDVLDLGKINSRFDDIYATNGTIQTSDQNEKQSIQSLTTAEMNVAKRLSPLIKTFKWNSSVEEKGVNARTHTGIIAQDVQQAFTDEGLDAGNYALFISSTWWEKEISVDAVAEEVDENGNIITEAKDAYTYMDIKEEATDGYTERTRLGVRYPELLSFIQAYNDQRFTELEARITTLENA